MAETYDDRVSHSENPTRFIKRRVSDVAPLLDPDDDRTPKINEKVKPALLTSAAAGGFAGALVDFTLYPLDTIKTRLQSQYGFYASGGFKGMYKGVLPVLLGSAPISAIFFATYNSVINFLRSENSALNPFIYLVAAGTAETISAALRVPIEVVKQRKQISNASTKCIVKKTLRKEGVLGFYRGLWSTLLREIPFSAIQFPLWELMIDNFIIYQNGKALSTVQTACCGSVAGAVAGAITTPLDVIKTRIMLAEKEKMDVMGNYPTWNYGKEIYQNQGLRGLFAGAIPRILWIMLGGFIYFGAYEKMKSICQGHNNLFVEEQKNDKIDIALSYEDFEELPSTDLPCLGEEDNEKISPENQNIVDTTLLEPSPGLPKI